jgi:hypothetical protein
MSDLEQLYKTQMQLSLSQQLDSAVQAGDINAARRATQQISELAIQNSKTASPAFTNADIRASLRIKAPWFGVDPRRSVKAVEFGKNMDPTSFKSADEFAEKLVEAVEEEFEDEEKPRRQQIEDDDDSPEDEEPEKRAARKKTDAPSSGGARAIPRRSSSGPWMKLSDAPKEIAQQIKTSADKFTRNATKEQRDRYIATALGTAYAADQRTRGKR